MKVMIFPISADEEPYEMTIKVRQGENSLKNTFTEDYFYWTKVFKGHSPVEPPSYSVFRKEIDDSNTL